MITSPAAAQPTKVLQVPRTDTPPKIDGQLNDPCWRQAARGGEFVLRGIGTPETEPTEFFVCYDSNALYFAFYCHDSQPDRIRASQTQRDASMWNDDFVQIYLDTYHDHRSAEEFFVNAIGTQSDVRKRGTASKISWKGDWLAASARVQDGWTAEMEIPFSILNYKAGATSMGLNVRRTQARLGETSVWCYLENDEQISRYGDLVGLVLPPPTRRRMQMMPYFLQALGAGGSSGGRIGLDIKQPFGEDNVFLFTAFPDFGTVENAIRNIDFSYTVQRYPDNRPFFQEASRIFGSHYIYTNNIPDFDYGTKVFGRRGKVEYGLMGCTSIRERQDGIVTLAWDLPRLTTAKALLVTRNDEDVKGKLISLGLRGQPAPSTSWWVEGANSIIKTDAKEGSSVGCGLSFNWPRLELGCSLNDVSRSFSPPTGYVDYPGSTSWDISGSWDLRRPDAKIRNRSVSISTQRCTDKNRGLIEHRTRIGAGLALANHSSWWISSSWGPHVANYDSDGTEPFRWNYDRNQMISYIFRNNDSHKMGSISFGWGRVAGGPSRSVRIARGWLPMRKLSSRLDVQRAHRQNPQEGNIVLWRGIATVRYELTPEKSLAARLLYQKSGLNLTLTYRQQVRRGLDIFALFGDYNAERTVSRFSIKLVATQ